jgi:hypothetical protein
MDLLVDLVAEVVIIRVLDLVELEHRDKEILVDLDIGFLVTLTLAVVEVVLMLLVEMVGLHMDMLDLVVMEFKFQQHLEILLLPQVIHQIHLLH